MPWAARSFACRRRKPLIVTSGWNWKHRSCRHSERPDWEKADSWPDAPCPREWQRCENAPGSCAGFRAGNRCPHGGRDRVVAEFVDRRGIGSHRGTKDTGDLLGPLAEPRKGRPLGHACADPAGLVVQGRMLVFLGHVERSTVDDRPPLIRPRQPQPLTLEGAQEKRLEPFLNCDVTTRSSGGSSPWRMRTIWRGMGLSIRTQAEIGAVRLWFGKRKSGA